MMADISLRNATPGDAEAMLELYAPIVRQTAISFEVSVPTVAEYRSRIETALTNWAWIVAERNRKVIGYAYGGSLRTREAYRWSVETSVNVAEDARGTGVGTSLYTELFDRLSTLGYCNAFAAIALPNEASIALHQRVGFTHIGVFQRVGHKFGRWHDVSWWQRRLRDEPPAEAATS